jgi:hypothetical protein
MSSTATDRTRKANTGGPEDHARLEIPNMLKFHSFPRSGFDPACLFLRPFPENCAISA